MMTECSAAEQCAAVSNSHAHRIYRSAHTAGQIRRKAQRACAGSISNPRKRREVYSFSDGSRLVITGHQIKIVGVNNE